MLRVSFSVVPSAVEDTERFRGGLVFKAHRLVHHSILGWRVIQKKKRTPSRKAAPPVGRGGGGSCVMVEQRRGEEGRALVGPEPVNER